MSTLNSPSRHGRDSVDGSLLSPNSDIASNEDVFKFDTKKHDLSEPIYQTTITLDMGEFSGFLNMSHDTFSVVAMRANQVNCIRQYTWSYSDVIHSLVCNTIERQFLLSVKVKNNGVKTVVGQADSDKPSCGPDITLDMMFASRWERDKFDFRFKMLTRLYTHKDARRIRRFVPIPTRRQESDGASSNDLPSPSNRNSFSESSHQSSLVGERPKVNVELDDMFSVENLAKMATMSIDGLPERSSLSSSTPEPNTSHGSQDANSSDELNSNGKFVRSIKVPVTMVNDPNKSSNKLIKAEATMSFRLLLDVAALMEARTIINTEERLNKLRQLIKMDATLCNLTFAPQTNTDNVVAS